SGKEVVTRVALSQTRVFRMEIDYEHSRNQHSLAGPKAALPLILEDTSPRSLLDVGCGPGTWLRAAMDCGISEICGLDGRPIDQGHLLFPGAFFRQQDLTDRWN